MNLATKTTLAGSLLFSLLLTPQAPSEACTRFVYKGPNQTVLTARSMDFSIDIPANLWVFPRGMRRNGEVGPNSVQWTSRYGSVIASSWDIGTSDGLNERGLVANLLFLVASKYPAFEKNGKEKGLAVSLWAQYALDNFATVKEAVEAFGKNEFVVVSDFIPGTDKYTTVHLSLSDAGGDNAVLEYIDGKLVIHHDSAYSVMTNDPPYDQQLAISSYWNRIPGNMFLPGTNHPSDRFARAAFYINAIPQTDDTRLAVASVFSVIRNCSVPYGITTPGFPNIASTRWRVVADHKNKVYYFENVMTPNTFWVDLKRFNLSPGSPVMKLDCDKTQTYSGEASAQFRRAQPFKFQGI